MTVLRKWRIAFYAYSPIAGAFLAKVPDQLLFGGQGRWDPTSSYAAKMYKVLYNKPSMLKALGPFVVLSNDSGIPQAELAYRWLAYNSHLRPDLGDGIVIGARFGPQVKDTLRVA